MSKDRRNPRFEQEICYPYVFDISDMVKVKDQGHVLKLDLGLVSYLLWNILRYQQHILTQLQVGPCHNKTICLLCGFSQQLWAASGNFWQNLWDSVYKLFGRNDFTVGVIGSILFTNCVIWGANAIFLVLDTTGKPGFLMKYKVQMDKNVPVDRKKLKKAVKLVLFNGFVVAFPMTLLGIYTMKLRGCAFSGDIPTFSRVVVELIMFSLVEEFGFYYSHRLMHHPIVYKYIHKIHHEWTAPIGIICIYAHPLEHCLVNMMPVILGPIIMGSHLSTTWMWYFITLVSTTISHCGYHFPFLPSQEAHDFHHQMFINCFGVLGILDRLHGTDNIFRASKAYKRDKISLSLIPMSQQYPD